MRRRAIGILVCVVLLGGLLGLYFVLQKNKANVDAQAQQTAEPDAAANQTVTLIDKNKEDLMAVTIKNPQGTFDYLAQMEPQPLPTPGATDAPAPTPLPDKLVWHLKDNPNVPLSDSTLESLTGTLYKLSVQKMMDNCDNPADFGLDQAERSTAALQFKDGSTATVYVGIQTPAKDFYYLQMAGDPALYLLNSASGQCFFYGLNDVVNKELPAIDAASLKYAYIAQEGKKPLEVAAQGTDDEIKKQMEQYGAASLAVLQPYPGRDLYMSNFQEQVLSNAGNIQLGSVVTLQPENLAQYGLDKPVLTIKLADASNQLELVIGSEADNDNYYCTANGMPYVFTTPKAPLASFFNLDIFKFISRFVALVNIDDCDGIDITAPGQADHITITHEVQPPADGQKEGTKVIHAAVNGQEVQEAAFKKFYQMIIGLSIDTEIDTMTPTAPPEVTITYQLNNGNPPVECKYYNYNKDFYAMQVGDEPVQFVINKQSFATMYNSLADMLAGKLDK